MDKLNKLPHVASEPKVFGFATDTDNGSQVFTFDREADRDAALVEFINYYLADEDVPQAINLEEAINAWSKLIDYPSGVIDSWIKFEHIVGSGQNVS